MRERRRHDDEDRPHQAADDELGRDDPRLHGLAEAGLVGEEGGPSEVPERLLGDGPLVGVVLEDLRVHVSEGEELLEARDQALLGRAPPEEQLVGRVVLPRLEERARIQDLDLPPLRPREGVRELDGGPLLLRLLGGEDVSAAEALELRDRVEPPAARAAARRLRPRPARLGGGLDRGSLGLDPLEAFAGGAAELRFLGFLGHESDQWYQGRATEPTDRVSFMQLGRYTVEREIGRGGMGAVYRGRAPDGRPVAIKLLLRPGSRDAAARFDRERRLLAEIGHGFVPLLDAGATAQGPYLVMPFVGGGTLRDRIERGPMPLDEAVSLGTALATAMGRAHAQGVVHRDLKPENVLFTETGFPLIADLGLAKHFSDEGGGEKSVSLSKTGESIGTAGYMAPEQINDAKSAGPPADVFALGAILYEMLTGTPAFAGDTMHQRHAKVASGTFEPVRRARSEVPKWLARVVERSLAPRQGARYDDG